MFNTPGPWKIEFHKGHAYGPRMVICAPDHEHRVAVISLNGAPNGFEEIAAANAYLIAAAPELLEALENLVSVYDGLGGHWDQARAAIAKAKVLP